MYNNVYNSPVNVIKKLSLFCSKLSIDFYQLKWRRPAFAISRMLKDFRVKRENWFNINSAHKRNDSSRTLSKIFQKCSRQTQTRSTILVISFTIFPFFIPRANYVWSWKGFIPSTNEEIQTLLLFINTSLWQLKTTQKFNLLFTRELSIITHL